MKSVTISAIKVAKIHRLAKTSPTLTKVAADGVTFVGWVQLKENEDT